MANRNFSNAPLYIVCTLTGLTLLSSFILTNTTNSTSASSSLDDPITITVASACTLSSTTSSYSRELYSGNSVEITGDAISAICNDASGYSLYAIGYSGDSYTTNNTKMLSSLGSSYDISTNTSGTSSYWAMKVNQASGNNPTITNSFNNYHVIPADYTQIATYNSSTTSSSSTGASIIPTYKVYASTSQPSGTYTGKIKYTLVHPSNAAAPSPKIYMQDLTLANCPTTETVVYDKRDETPYRVQKLADNKCWMLDNLALDLTALTQAQLYGTGDNAGKMTNASNEALGYLKGATTGTSSDQWAMAAVKKTWTSSYSYSQPWIAVDSTTSGGCNDAYCVDGGAADSPWSYDSVTSETINEVTSIAQGKIGVYYNYCAASAGSYCYGNGTSYTGSPSSDPVADSIRDITDDICPYKWRLPTGGSTGEFQYLYSQYSGGSPSQVAAFQTALSTPLSGNFYSGKAYNQGNRGGFWSSTWGNTGIMYILYVSSSKVSPSNYNNRYYGNSVRCILAE